MRLLQAIFILLALTISASAGDALIVKESANSVPDTLNKLEGVLKSKGLTIFARVDHAAGAKKVGLELPPTQLLIFGNPKMGTLLMQSESKIGLDLPMKVLAWQDAAGKVWLSYTSPAELKKRHGIGDRDKVFEKMTGALNKFTTLASQKAK